MGRRPLRIGVLTTHPIQYQVPWFRLLEADPRVDLEVFFCSLPDAEMQGAGFGVAFEWDVPLLDGYRYRVLENRAKRPSVVRFDGCDTPEIGAVVCSGGWDAFVVNGWMVKSCLQLLWACRRHGVPCLVRGEVNGLRPRAWWKRWVHRALFTQYAGFLAIGTRNRDYYLAHGVDRSKIWMTPYGVENERFPFAERGERDRGGEPFRFLFTGKLEPKKRPMDIIAACGRLERMGRDDFEVLIVGDGELRERLAAASHGLPVRMLGFVNQSGMARAYAQADCLLLPSDSGETWGLVVNEAMATGLPAIVSDSVGCAVDLVEPGVTGERFALGDVDALANRMLAMLADRARARRMGKEAAARVRSRFAPEHVAAGVIAASEAVSRGKNS